MYYPYGEERWHTSTLPTDYRFTGQRLDGYINLYAMGARQYDPSLGRWISADSIIPDSRNPQSFNRYTYVSNNPVLYRDPSGHAQSTGNDKEGGAEEPPTIEEIIEAIISVAPSDADALIILFLTDILGSDPSAAARLDLILAATSMGAIPRQFKITFGESGFATEFQDGHLYEELWGMSRADTNQVGHFLTAVSLGYKPFINEAFSKGSIVGHEQIADNSLMAPGRAPFACSAEERGIFQQAVDADAEGYYNTRDVSLRVLLGSGDMTKRQGNSMEDLRLSVRGWRMGQMVASKALSTRQDVAAWVTSCIAAR